jgi:hypothetical protein
MKIIEFKNVEELNKWLQEKVEPGSNLRNGELSVTVGLKVNRTYNGGYWVQIGYGN